jgi:hypothetical protein
MYGFVCNYSVMGLCRYPRMKSETTKHTEMLKRLQVKLEVLDDAQLREELTRARQGRANIAAAAAAAAAAADDDDDDDDEDEARSAGTVAAAGTAVAGAAATVGAGIATGAAAVGGGIAAAGSAIAGSTLLSSVLVTAVGGALKSSVPSDGEIARLSGALAQLSRDEMISELMGTIGHPASDPRVRRRADRNTVVLKTSDDATLAMMHDHGRSSTVVHRIFEPDETRTLHLRRFSSGRCCRRYRCRRTRAVVATAVDHTKSCFCCSLDEESDLTLSALPRTLVPLKLTSGDADERKKMMAKKLARAKSTIEVSVELVHSVREKQNSAATFIIYYIIL